MPFCVLELDIRTKTDGLNSTIIYFVQVMHEKTCHAELFGKREKGQSFETSIRSW